MNGSSRTPYVSPSSLSQTFFQLKKPRVSSPEFEGVFWANNPFCFLYGFGVLRKPVKPQLELIEVCPNNVSENSCRSSFVGMGCEGRFRQFLVKTDCLGFVLAL